MRLNIYLAVLLLLAVQSSAALKSELRFDTGPDVCPLTKCECVVFPFCIFFLHNIFLFSIDVFLLI
jgi:hypothetical protein